MKRSEYRAKRAADYSTDPAGIPDQWLDHDCQAAEAAGVVWDPEEKALPEKITWRRYTASIHGVILVDTRRSPPPLLFPVGGAGVFGNPAQEDAAYEEAVRRWGAISQAKTLVKEMLCVYGTRGEDYARLKKLEAVLEGKEP